ncbi:hypothetical protein PG997_003419 [Apiospora hydei]|uniref:SnoaL-like domain-containing protein n=1 Tax=Apiospora hydei TaxID=1337664 RepID=A0ABR1WZ78_9PEZI
MTHHGNQEEEDQVLATVTAFLDSVSEKPTPLTETHKHVLPSAYAVDWRVHAGELIQTPRNAYVAEMERRLDRMREAGLRSFVQALADPPPARTRACRRRGSGSMRGKGLPRSGRGSTEEVGESGGGGGWKIAAFVDSRWDPEYFRPRPTAVAQATEELLAAARAFTDLLNSGKGSELFQDLLLADETAGQQRRNIEVLNGEGRAVGGVGFLWMHYTVVMTQEDGQTPIRGTATLTFLQRNGKWLVSGVQEAERLSS